MKSSKLQNVINYINHVAKQNGYDVDSYSNLGDMLEDIYNISGIEHIEQEGGEGEGEYWHVVYKVAHPKYGDVFVKVTGHYDSWNGVDYDYGSTTLCFKQPVTRMEFVDIENTSDEELTYEEPKKYLDFSDEVTKAWFINVLKVSSVILEFTKADGTQRVMKCTLNPKEIPEMEPSSTKRAEPKTAFRVYDLEKKDWRSVRWNYINKMHIEV